jgi:hypothetical protein
MIETIGFILFILAVVFVAMGPKAPEKKSPDKKENDSDPHKSGPAESDTQEKK